MSNGEVEKFKLGKQPNGACRHQWYITKDRVPGHCTNLTCISCGQQMVFKEPKRVR